MRILLYILLGSICYGQVKIISENTEEITNANGSRTMNIYADPLYYLKDSTWDNIDTRWTDSTTYWVIYKSKYTIRVKKQFTSAEAFQFFLDPDDLTFEPDDIIIDSNKTLKPVNVTGYLKDSNTIRFDNCYGAGIHYEITGKNGMHVTEIIDSTADLGMLYRERDIKGGDVIRYPILSKHLQIRFKLVDKDIKVKKRGKTAKVKDWDGSDKRADKVKFDKFELGDIPVDRKVSKKEYKLEKKGSTEYISKMITSNNFRGIKTNLDISVGTWSECLRNPYPTTESWETIHTGAGTGSSTANGQRLVQYKGTGADMQIHRLYYSFTLPTGYISAAEISCYIQAYNGTTYLSDIYIIDNTRQSTSFVNSDYQSTTFANYGYKDIVAGDNTTTVTVPFSTAGLTYLNTKTGSIAIIGLCNQWDFANTGYQSVSVGETLTNTKLVITLGTAPGGGTTVNKKPHIINMHTP